jgi:hypothetical protein
VVVAGAGISASGEVEMFRKGSIVLLRSARVGAARCFETKTTYGLALIPPQFFYRAYTARIRT